VYIFLRRKWALRLRNSLIESGFGGPFPETSDVKLAWLNEIKVLLIKAIWVRRRLFLIFTWRLLLPSEVMRFGLIFLPFVRKLVVLRVELLQVRLFVLCFFDTFKIHY
jgi:hypothetical protein